MKNYKEFEKQSIGSSDIASLILVGCGEGGLKLYELHFGGDGSYDAYIIDGDAEIAPHYSVVAEFSAWLKVYDDDGLTARFSGKRILVYRAAEMGCIIQVFQ